MIAVIATAWVGLRVSAMGAHPEDPLDKAVQSSNAASMYDGAQNRRHDSTNTSYGLSFSLYLIIFSSSIVIGTKLTRGPLSWPRAMSHISWFYR